MSAKVVNLPVQPKPKKASPYQGPLQVQKLDKWAKNPPATTVKVSDGEGLYAQITPKGWISFQLQYKHDGKRKFYGLGRYGDVSLSEARTAAADAKKLVRKGVCPQEQKEAEKEAQKAEKRRKAEEPTISEALESYITKHVSGLARGREVEQAFRNDVMPVIGDLKVKEVRRRELLELVERKAEDAPAAARRLLAYTKTFFGWCVDREYIDASPAAHIKPSSVKVAGKKNALKPNHRERVLTEAEIKEFWQAEGMRKLTHLALKLVLVTGQRPGEVAGMHHSEIKGDTWVIPAERRLKTETSHSVPLCPLALEIIEGAKAEVTRLEKRRKKDSQGFVFSAGDVLRVHTLSQAIRRHHDKGWRPHDLRRTCRTGLSELGIGDEVAEMVIGHTKKGIIQVYNRNQYTEAKREALEAWEARIRGVVE